jgi:LDH2 family malate/lactate/ureidoglycolate dehydrogenase
MSIDTLGFARRLEASGMPREHSEAYATVLLNALRERNGSACTYDTPAHISQLEAAGVPRQQAQGWVDALPLAIGECRESLPSFAR